MTEEVVKEALLESMDEKFRWKIFVNTEGKLAVVEMHRSENGE